MTFLPPLTPEQDAAVRDAIADYAGAALVMRYVVVAECLPADGDETGLASFESPDLAVWDAIGMLRATATARESDFARGWNEGE